VIIFNFLLFSFLDGRLKMLTLLHKNSKTTETMHLFILNRSLTKNNIKFISSYGCIIPPITLKILDSFAEDFFLLAFLWSLRYNTS